MSDLSKIRTFISVCLRLNTDHTEVLNKLSDAILGEHSRYVPESRINFRFISFDICQKLFVIN
jgi:hypothetical protein